MKHCYAIYRLPDEGDRASIVESDHAVVLQSPTDADGQTGFLVAPFEVGSCTPRLLLAGLPQSFCPPEWPSGELPSPTVVSKDSDREAYHRQFERFHQAIQQGRCSKLVLARQTEEHSDTPLPPQLLFQRACRAFPHCFIALFHTPQTGTWLTATPEILLEQTGQRCHTMALAGTMPAPDNEDTGQTWSEKNRTEQQYVADYIRMQLAPLADQLEETAPQTFVAGNVMHLRSDFHFTAKPQHTFGEMAAALHPTPAVCGVPTVEARRFILDNEQHPRAYYSGYCGPLSPTASHLFVMLRCMSIADGRYRLYAGGGLVGESTEQDEWEETEAKLYAMRKVKSEE